MRVRETLLGGTEQNLPKLKLTHIGAEKHLLGLIIALIMAEQLDTAGPCHSEHSAQKWQAGFSLLNTVLKGDQ